MLVRGVAGVGKTTLMQETVEAIETAGTRVVALAPTAEASRGVMRTEGFGDADTDARFLLDEKLQSKARGAVIWIDEAGLLGAKTMGSVFTLADQIDARVLLTGDARQHASVERGESFQDWLNAFEYHRDSEKRARIERICGLLSFDVARGLFVSMLLDKINAIMNLAVIIRRCADPDARPLKVHS